MFYSLPPLTFLTPSPTLIHRPTQRVYLNVPLRAVGEVGLEGRGRGRVTARAKVRERRTGRIWREVGTRGRVNKEGKRQVDAELQDIMFVS